MRIAARWTLRAESLRATTAFASRAIDVEQFSEPESLLEAWKETDFDAILVQGDTALSRDWLDVLRTRGASRAPIVAVGAGDTYSIAQALMRGADDYATEAEGATGLVQRVLARVRAGASPSQGPTLRVGLYSLDTAQALLASPNHRVRLTARECSLAQVLFEHPGRLATVEMLSAALFGNTEVANKRSIEQHLYKLRQKCVLVSKQQGTPLHIESVYASGYRLRA